MEPLIPIMTPAPGERLQRFVGDRVRFVLEISGSSAPLPGWRARLRTNLGRAETLRREILQAHTQGLPSAGAAWRDLPMCEDTLGWSLEVLLGEEGFFQAKAYLIDPNGWQHWPNGADTGISVHPNAYRTANTIYCAFPRLFGESRKATRTERHPWESAVRQLDGRGYAVIPPSGKLRDLAGCLPHIIDGLGCRILHLLPVSPTPTTYARLGRFGSPYAALDLVAIDPALVEFDQRTTGVDQFRELTCAAHMRGARVVLDIVINHTGWGSRLQEVHPEWFVRDPDGTFASPGAWGVTWKDLVELRHDNVALWDKLANMFLIWCRRGVDGFRCDAGYKVPVRAWQYIVARVQQEFPETIFLLEGLGGSWEATGALLTEGGMQWAYSELFQNYSGTEVAAYLDYALCQSGRLGLYVHYSETHDNDRLAAKTSPGVPAARRVGVNRAWSLLRNRLCALSSVSGAFGFTCGVEWLATEKISVHESTGLAWGRKENLVAELGTLNRLLGEHPCFFDGARLTRLSPADSPVYALLRESAEGKDSVLVLVNTDVEKEHSFNVIPSSPESAVSNFTFDLLGQTPPEIRISTAGTPEILLPAGGAYCLSTTSRALGLAGDAYRRSRAQSAWGVQALTQYFPDAVLGRFSWQNLAEAVDRSPFAFLAGIRHLNLSKSDLDAALREAIETIGFPCVVRWSLADRRRVTPVPPHHWLLVEDPAPFRASLRTSNGASPRNVESIVTREGHVAFFAPRQTGVEAQLVLERYAESDPCVEASIRFLSAKPTRPEGQWQPPSTDALVLLTNGIGGMARLCVDLGRIRSKYDCVLGANLHPSLPADRHVFVKRLRVWVNADGFLSALDLRNLAGFEPGPPAIWRFVANAGDGRTVEVEMRAAMVPNRNTTQFRFSRPSADRAAGKQLPADADVRLTVRVDIEDRNFHWETRRNSGAEHHFTAHTRELTAQIGFAFTPAQDRQLHVVAETGRYHAQPEWSEGILHPVEKSRGQTGSGDAFSPGWFDLPLPKGACAALVVTAEPDAAKYGATASAAEDAADGCQTFEDQLLRASRAFVVRRGTGKTVIAGYPWFLDWGRDTFICARGLLAAGWSHEVEDILLTFARFEKHGTLPNTILGEDASNRDTSDAPLWFALVCHELAAQTPDFYAADLGNGRNITEVLCSIAAHYIRGTPNGIRMDPDSALIWSPGHFTWMDTNHPAGSPREGFPVEIQALWMCLLRQLAAEVDPAGSSQWHALADRARGSFEKLFWLEPRGYYADVLLARQNESAAAAIASDALRSNCLFPISLGIVTGDRAQRCVAAALRHLLVPGALRSLAPLPVSVPLPIFAPDGQLLNDPDIPYRGCYLGDEDTFRKPAYHNGTAWTWTLPVFCEALARAWNNAPDAVAAARAYLSSMDRIMNEGCLGQIPEILDGDAPHTPRGCDAQAWSVTESLRVWRFLNRMQSLSVNATAKRFP